MVKREIIFIDEEKCNGCGQCVPNCAEGAIKIIDGKAKVIDDKYCDGLGACLGHCPEDALKIVERETVEFDEQAVEDLLAQQKKEKQAAAVKPAPDHGCPGSMLRDLSPTKAKPAPSEEAGIDSGDISLSIKSQLGQWPVQLALVPIQGDLWKDADVLITASCVPVAYPNYHLNLLKGKKAVIGCPKLDNLKFYTEKMVKIFAHNSINSVTVAFMEVPCCGGIVMAVEQAIKAAGKDIPVKRVKIGIKGDILS
ncbi:4Fe-4S binding protein [Metallumcola ferriviriculae]|uniref:4Fe-4S binding protein n=1 Tax=Metallumcola ferriviriculae TaxID=3039180 RepID=A0AAU0UKA1_9FIRM|nr:4Fe-4S binding protein [Desulfitibacteraceae bacterium MK1]